MTLRLLTWLILWSAAIAAAVCASYTRVLTDHAGRRVEVPERPQRIVSLAPAITETLFALGVGERVAAVTDYCDYPEEARAKPKVGGMINPSIEAIVAAQPDLVLHTIEGNRRETLEALERLNLSVFVFNPTTMGDVFRTVRDLGSAAGVPDRAEELAGRLQAESAAIERAIRGRPARRVLFLVWLNPIVSVGRGSFLNDVLSRSGAESISAGIGQPWPHVSLEEILRSDPDYLLVPRTPWFGPTRDELLKLPGWRELRAVRNSRIVYLPAAVERPGPRLVAMQAQIARALHPAAFTTRPASARPSRKRRAS